MRTPYIGSKQADGRTNTESDGRVNGEFILKKQDNQTLLLEKNRSNYQLESKLSQHMQKVGLLQNIMDVGVKC